jgi:hypothetical protein
MKFLYTENSQVAHAKAAVVRRIAARRRAHGTPRSAQFTIIHREITVTGMVFPDRDAVDCSILFP